MYTMAYLLGRISRPNFFLVDLNLINNPRYQVTLNEKNLKEGMDNSFEAAIALGYRGFRGPSGRRQPWRADNDTTRDKNH